MYLVGDIGATHSRFALVMPHSFEISTHCHFFSHHYLSFEDVIAAFLGEIGPRDIEAAVFAMPGIVHEDIATLTNLPWREVHGEMIKHSFGFKHVFLLNDVEGHAWFVSDPHPEGVAVIFPGKICIGNRALVAPGTGLGEAGIHWDGSVYRAFATEGGHVDFAPKDPLQVELYAFLQHEFGHVSYERVLSGPGIVSIYQFLRRLKRVDVSAELSYRLSREDPASVITEEGLSGRCEICSATLNLFCAILGAELGNCALKYMARGGVFLAGGIPPKMLSKLYEPLFKESYLDKGRFSSLLEQIPVSVIKESNSCIKGAAKYAAFKLAR